MNVTIIHEEPIVKVTYNQEYKMIKMEWNGSPSLDQYSKAFTMALEFQEKSTFPVHNFVSDIRNQGIMNPENRKWFEHVALPRAVKQGLKRAAVIFDGNVFKKYYLNLILQATNVYKLPFKFFSSHEEALAWFKSFKD